MWFASSSVDCGMLTEDSGLRYRLSRFVAVGTAEANDRRYKHLNQSCFQNSVHATALQS